MTRIDAGALLFDLDGLMVDSEPLWFQIERELVRARARPPAEWTRAHFDACVGQGIPALLRSMEATFGFPVDVERDTNAIVDTYVGRVGDLELKPGCRELVEAARGVIPIAVASSSARRLVDAVLARFDMTTTFDAVVAGDASLRHKPAPDIFLEAARRLNVPPPRCVVLEDSLAGATAGFAAKMTVIAVPEGPHAGRGFEAVTHAIIPSLIQARALLMPFSAQPTRPRR